VDVWLENLIAKVRLILVHAVTTHLVGMHTAIKMLSARVKMIQQLVVKMKSGEEEGEHMGIKLFTSFLECSRPGSLGGHLLYKHQVSADKLSLHSSKL
jgi:hypothetical protein